MPSTSFRITVDSRESRSGVAQQLEGMGYLVDRAELPLGDYRIGDRVLVERKEANDLALSVMDGRLFNQARSLVDAAPVTAIIVEGNLSGIWSRIEQEALAGALSALVVFFGVSLLPSENAETTARLIGRLGTHAFDGLGYEIAARVNKPKQDGAVSQYLLEGLPGIGAEGARKLLTHFGSARAVFAASIDDLCAVPGIGPKSAAGIIAALDHRPTRFHSTKKAPF